MRAPAELTELFRQRGLKVTPQRQRIFQVLAGNRVHPTAESVYATVRAELPTISLKTVYQILNELVALGEILQLDLGTGASRFDPNVSQHHHLVCVACGKVCDLYANYGDLQVPPEQQQGFTVRSAEVVFRGLCDQCNKKKEERAPHA
ncbi:MAG: transcriptional repressor [Chloroflexi bacterium]|nr:transcriptional repressor [Chloroflexota bacterium]